MADSPQYSPELINSLLADIPPIMLLAWLDLQLHGREILRGFQQNTKSLRLPPVRARFKDVLSKHPDVTESLIDAWKLGNGKILDEVHALTDKKLLSQLPQLKEEHGERTMHLTLMLDGREKLLQQETTIVKPKKQSTKPTQKRNPPKKLRNWNIQSRRCKMKRKNKKPH